MDDYDAFGPLAGAISARRPETLVSNMRQRVDELLGTAISSAGARLLESRLNAEGRSGELSRAAGAALTDLPGSAEC